MTVTRETAEDSNVPAIGRSVRATTTTATAQSVVIEVTAIDRETESGWYVWGYRIVRRSTPRQTSYPRLYFVARWEW
jgi:hypothetical protein